jgi:hypothetical protein
MNYLDLATRLSELSTRLGKHAEKIEGEAVGRAAGKLLAQLNLFEEQLDGFLASRKSGELLLETLLRSPAGRKHVSIDLLKKGFREVLGKRLKSEDLPTAKYEFVKAVHEKEKAVEATKFLKEAFSSAAQVASGGKDRNLLQREFIRLGVLENDEFEREIEKRTFGELRRLAAVNGIRFTDKTTKERLTLLLRRYSQRAAVNIIRTP